MTCVNSFLEFGPNIGINLLAIKKLFPEATLNAVEINYKAFDILKKLISVKIYGTNQYLTSVNKI